MNTLINNQYFANWHFARRDVAENYLKTLSSGIILSTTIYAPPQTGLTQFLLHDVMAEAQREKYLTVYVDLSDSRLSVSLAMLVGLEQALDESSMVKTSCNFIKGVFQSRSLKIGRVEAYLRNLYKEDAPYPLSYDSGNIFLIDKYIKKILRTGPVVIVIDHAHKLMKDEAGIEFSRYFKALIVDSVHTIRPLYATNDMNAWSEIFENRNSLLHSEDAVVHHLPLLGESFIREVLRRSRLHVLEKEMMQCFHMVGHRPGVFLRVLKDWSSENSSPLIVFFEEYGYLRNGVLSND